MKATSATTARRKRTPGKTTEPSTGLFTWALGNEGSLELDANIQAGLSRACLTSLQKRSRLPLKAAQSFVIRESQRGRSLASAKLTTEESERLVRLALLYSRTVELFEGQCAAAAKWLLRPCADLGRRTPLDVAHTEFGAGEVHRLIDRIEQGVLT